MAATAASTNNTVNAHKYSTIDAVLAGLLALGGIIAVVVIIYLNYKAKRGGGLSYNSVSSVGGPTGFSRYAPSFYNRLVGT
jgi:hypothetical protein